MNDKRWITKNGRRILINNYISYHPMKASAITNDYMNDKIKKTFTSTSTSNENQDQIDKDITNVVNTGQVFEFSIGPQMTLCSRYENGDYTWRHQSQDEPMWRFEEAIVPELKDEFVVIDQHYGKVPRTSRFKKYGYEVVGETKARKRNIMEGIYDNESVDYGDETWYLMRKKGVNK